MKQVLLMILVLVATSSTAIGSVLRGDQNSDSAYPTIQQAVDAAASGDTISIAPGRYDNPHVVDTPGWSELVRVVVRVERLTFIGSGSDQTIIGPADPWDLDEDGWNRGIVAASVIGSGGLVIELRSGTARAVQKLTLVK